MELNTNQCLFCGTPLTGKRSVEHVFPQWLQEKYGLHKEGVLQTHFSEVGDVLSSRHHSLAKHVCGRICKACNNGWMAQIETKTKPLVCDLAEHRYSFSDLNSQQCLLLALWACKTAYSLHAASNYRMIVPEIHLRLLANQTTGLPEGVWVFGHQHNCSEPFAWWQSPSWHITADEEILTEDFLDSVSSTAYKICFSIRDLALIVAYNPFPNMRLVLWKYFHYPIWPDRGPVFWYERDNLPKDNTHSVCIALMSTMGLQQIEGKIE